MVVQAQASRARLGIGLASAQADERGRIDIEPAHHLVHAYSLAFHGAVGIRSHTASSCTCLHPLRLFPRSRMF